MGNATGGKFSSDNAPTPQPINRVKPMPQPTNQGKFSSIEGANGVLTHSATSGQPTIGAANQYSNTVGQCDNIVQQPNKALSQPGKGKGA